MAAVIFLMLAMIAMGCGVSGAPDDAPLTDTAPEISLPEETPAVGNTADGPAEEAEMPLQPEAVFSIVCTIFPQYDWVREIIGDTGAFDLTLLADSRVDLHSYQPSVDDIIKISSSDVFIYIGGDSDEWVVNVLREAVNPDIIAVSLMEILGAGVKFEEMFDGMYDQAPHSCDSHGHHHHDEDGDCDVERHTDEHVWLSLNNAKAFVSAIADTLTAIDPHHAEAYRQNAIAYMEELAALDAAYQAAVDAANVDTLLFGDRFPFRYLMDDYGLNYYAAFSGCSAETEASFGTIVFLATKMDELNLDSIMVTESADQAIARTVIDSASGEGRRILVLDAMQSVTAADVRDGVTYLSIMEKNLETLKEALH
jgi:zinc transport system substrate-binding protein